MDSDKYLPVPALRMEIDHFWRAPKDIVRSISQVEVYVQYRRLSYSVLFPQLGYGYRHIVEKAAPLAVAAAGVMARRSY